MYMIDRWFHNDACPIGIDLGTCSIKMVQAVRDAAGNASRLHAATSIALPASVSAGSLAGRLQFFRWAVRQELKGGRFIGRDAVVAIPAPWVSIHCLRLPTISNHNQLAAMVERELMPHLPPLFDLSQVAIRHVVAGQVYQGQTPCLEVIAMVSRHQWINSLAAAALQTGLRVVGMPSQAPAMLASRAISRHESGNAADERGAHLYIDLGHSGIRVYAARGMRLLFARTLEHSAAPSSAASSELQALEARPADRKVPVARSLLLDMWSPASGEDEGGSAVAVATSPAVARPQAHCKPHSSGVGGALLDELQRCCRYIESSFPHVPLERVIFTGGGAAQTRLCREMAESLNMPAHVANPLARLASAPECSAPRGTSPASLSSATALSVNHRTLC